MGDAPGRAVRARAGAAVTHVILAEGPGGAETLALDLAAAQREAGRAASIVALFALARIGRDPGYEAAFRARARERDVPVTNLGLGGIRDLLTHGGALRRAIAEQDAGLVHVHVGSALLPLSLRQSGRATVYTLHSAYLPFATRWFRLFDRALAHNVGVCSAGTELLARASRRPATTVRNGRRAASAAVRQVAADGRLRLLAVGSLLKEKDYPTLVAAMALVVAQLGSGSIRLRIAGDGPLHREIAGSIAAAGLDGIVELLGARSDVDALMADADLLVSSSATEGLPMSMIEALQAGLPIVATDVGGVADIVADGSSGRLVPAGDPAALATAIVALARDPALRTAMGAEASARASLFSLEACREGYDAVYAAALARGAR